ncbi:MAG TPA: hypothetical protein VLZ33_01810 [Dysgonamonadaceae bacterium]|nr:hypothetical protein [Dysgonamonadaceae bacterium]
MKDIVSYPCNVASTNFSCLFLLGDRISQLEKYEAVYLNNTMTKAIEKIVDHIIEEIAHKNNLETAQNHLVRAFTYCFDKSLEIVYKIRAQVDEGVEFNFSDLYNGMGGDKVPEYIQLKVTPIIPKIVMVFNETIDHINKKKYTKQITIRELAKAILFAGVYLGTEFCLRIDMQDYSEFNKYMMD